ncbi:MAG: glycosyltransferase [Alphaproteobacteria bacterium]|nr:glycosyltransferase [Alphaproteobacteria bacterium]
MDKNNVKISVVIPVYNVEKYLSRCLDSIILQTYENLEIICVNDGSTDGSPKILEDYAERDKRIRIITQENQGLSGARNSGMHVMTGDYFTFVDSDDWLQLGAYQKFMDVLQTEERVIDIFLFNGFRYMQDNLLTTPTITKIFNIQDWGDFTESHFKTIRQHKDPLYNTMAVWNKIYRTDWFRQYNFQFMDKMIGEDRLFSAQTYLSTDNVYVLEDYLYCYRKLPGSLSYTSDENIFKFLKIADEVKKVYIQKDFYKQSIFSYWEYLLREGLSFLKNCQIYLREDYLHEVRQRLKPVVAELDQERYKKDKNFQLSEDLLRLDADTLCKKYRSLHI